jgi:uncharacterized protein (TIGR03435 family)
MKLLVTLIAGAGAFLIQAQESPRPSFEAAVVKPSGPGRQQFRMEGGPGTPDPGQFTWRSVPLLNMIMVAYDVKPFQVLRPDWVDSAPFDLTAKVPKGASEKDLRAMLQDFLVSGFRMSLRRETRDTRAWALTIAKGGIRMSEIKNAAVSRGSSHAPPVRPPEPGLFHIDGVNRTMIGITQIAYRQLGEPVIDMTGLSGNYNFVLDYAPNGRLPMGVNGIPIPNGNPAGASDSGWISGKCLWNLS